MATVGLDFFTKDEMFEDTKIRIKIWDTAGQERYKSLTQGFFRNAQGIMIVYDVTNIDSFDNLKYWIQSINSSIDNENNNVPCIIIGNKIDLKEREVSYEKGEIFAKEQKYKYFETSAKSGEGVEESIRFLVEQILNIRSRVENKKEKSSIKLEEGTKDVKLKLQKCCNKD